MDRERLKVLSDREFEIARFAAHGIAIDEIADELCISSGTVKWHMRNIYAKLQFKGHRVSKRYQLIRIMW